MAFPVKINSDSQIAEVLTKSDRPLPIAFSPQVLTDSIRTTIS